MAQQNAPSDASTSSTVIIDPDGDLYLRLPHDKILKVSSKVLMVASPVFAAMLGPKFAEGQRLATATKPMELNLREDNGDAMVMMCQMLHHRTNFASPFDSVDCAAATQILEFAVVLDKYDTSQALQAQVQWGFLRQNDTMDVDSLEAGANLIAASFVLGIENHFERLTGETIRLSSVPFTEILKYECMQFMPVSILVFMEQRRAQYVKELQNAWHLASGTSGELVGDMNVCQMRKKVNSKIKQSYRQVQANHTGLCLKCMRAPDFECSAHDGSKN